MLTGLIAKGVADAAKPDADLRQWDNLPEYVHIAAARLTLDTERVTARFVDGASNQVLPERDVEIRYAGKCGIGWVRSHSALKIPNDAPESSSKEYFVNKPQESEKQTEEGS